VKEILDDITRWRNAGKKIAVARVIDVEGSGPRDAGAAMAVTQDGEVAGSVSGGCVEGAVVTEALEVLSSGTRGRRVTFGYSDDEAFAVGLTCGGTVHLFIQPLDETAFAALATPLQNNNPVVIATVCGGPNIGSSIVATPESLVGTLGNNELDRVASRDARGDLDLGRTTTRHYGPEGQTTPGDLEDTNTVTLFIESFAPAPEMWIFGAVDFTAALARVAKVLGYRVTVCDAREMFATKKRFPMADDVKVTWPGAVFAEHGKSLGPRDAVCILTHDPKFDVPAIEGALASKVGYIGVMGSRKTIEKRLQRLADVGITSAEDLARLMQPIGLDIGSRTPEETAISICGEIIACRSGRTATSLRNSSGPIHAN
jgi:xanthine dehydrogenase accessory factor